MYSNPSRSTAGTANGLQAASIQSTEISFGFEEVSSATSAGTEERNHPTQDPLATPSGPLFSVSLI